ncbi:MAG: ATP-binding protein [Chloroflexota bacterium]
MSPTSASSPRIDATIHGVPIERMLRKAAELEAVFESLGDGLLVVNASAHIVEANQAAVTLLAFQQKDELFGPVSTGLHARATRTDGTALQPDDLGLWSVLRDGTVQRAECVLRHQFGGPRWIETVSGPIRDTDGTILGASIVARDVTHQRRRERDFGLVAAVTDALMSAVDVPAALGNLAGRCVHDLGDWCAVFQVDGGSDILRLAAMRQRDGRHGSDIADLLARQPARASEGFAGAAMRAGEVLLLADLTEERIRRHAGRGVEAQIVQRLGLRSIIVAPLRGNDGPVGAVCVGWAGQQRQPDQQDAWLVDELARRASMAIEQARYQQALHQALERTDLALEHTEQALERSEQALERLDQVLDSMGAGLLIFGSDGQSILINHTARDMIGLADDGLGVRLGELLAGYEDHFEDPGDVAELVERTLLHAVDARGRFRLRAPSPIDIEWIATPVRDGAGLVLGQVMVWVDVTHIRAAERVKDDLAGDLSEALRSPLQAISTHAVQALRRGRRLGGDSALLHGLEVILRNARQVSMHVNDLVDAARFDATNLSLDLVEVDVRATVEQAVDQARAMTTIHRFRLDVPPAIPPPRWDPDRVRQALLHVLSNSIKYAPDGGQISVKVRAQVEGVIISVRDRGLGIPPDEQERVFERFYRLASDPARRRIRGNGLGLYLVRGVIEAHGGTIWVESTGLPGEGTTVNVLLPWLPGTPLAN